MRLVICVPGKSFSGDFLDRWTAFTANLLNSGFEVTFSRKYSPDIFICRNLCLGGDYKHGWEQQPFNGKILYDYILWIDSDILFKYSDFEKLLKRNVDICSGAYKMQDGRYPISKNWNLINPPEYMESIEGEDLIKVIFAGMGFMLVKYGVFEKIKYPCSNSGSPTIFAQKTLAFVFQRKIAVIAYLSILQSKSVTKRLSLFNFSLNNHRQVSFLP